MTVQSNIERCMANGWSDGLPVVPPTLDLVQAMVEKLGWNPTDVVATLDKQNLEVRADQVAATAVLAGCLPDYAPVLRPLADALLDATFNLHGIAVTTGGAGLLVVVSGPVVDKLGFAHGANAAGGSATRINATVGRFAALMMRFYGLVGMDEFGTIGHPGRLSYCIAEQSTTTWLPFHTQIEIPAEASAVTIIAAEGPNSVNNHYATDGGQILETIADTIAHAGTTNYYFRNGTYLVMLAPEHLALVAATFTRDQARDFLFSKAVRNTDELIRLGRIPPTPRADALVQPGLPRSPLAERDKLLFIESGGITGKFSAVIPGWVANRTVSRIVQI